ncbi:hypothetical protein FPE01S_01_16850 [Flavihumibacter petaseus NBRC 106054]|uniref:ASPIC/UnbV domain-containing protein n=1 Tax=Flavihumibacter petaseus NBRC 106054 TaxID=1220578 RepID=A0A0E9MZW3_9BACT|nr:hypothetical protein FPE01S_01_16850 [Flavihumibacter petaseus NBRC 106054]
MSLAAAFAFTACRHQETGIFRQLSSSHTGIHFSNKISESDSINPMNVVNIYNGGGVGIGDFNGDGLADMYFTGNMVPNKLYLNKGNLAFEDVTEKAGVDGMGRWARGVSVVDINNDGKLDIYVCNTIYKDSLRRRNILYVNQGNDAGGIPRFKDDAAAWGLDINVQSTMAQFFDYDNDGDLDMYLTVNEAANGIAYTAFSERNGNATHSEGRLYRNETDSASHHPVYRDVSLQAGITLAGFGHSATICDINADGWKDIYVANDFISSNILYINNHDGTFSDRAKDYFKHTSLNAMGSDVVDINNDGLVDVVELDMNPEDNFRKKMMMNAGNYNTIQNFELFKYQLQYIRNTFQLNQGPRLLEGDSIGAPVFSEIAFMSGMSQTDWSWTPLVADFDNDGFRDMIITNGFPKDVTDHDFIAYREKSNGLEPPLQMMGRIPVVKISNYAYRNTNGVQFEDMTKAWGFTRPGFSNGAVYADLDNDGDMDIVINNIDDEAFVYENRSRQAGDTASHYLQVAFRGSPANINGLGASADIYYDHGKHQLYENLPVRGYLSTNQGIAHFGLGKTTVVDSVVITWPENKKQVFQQVKADQLLKADLANAAIPAPVNPQQLQSVPIFREITRLTGLGAKHTDFDFIDFNVQTTLPHKFSQYCPALAAGDINGDGLDDIIMGGNNIYPAKVLLQQPNGKFREQQMDEKAGSTNVNFKDEGIVLFDADGDGFNDVYVASGGFNYAAGDAAYQDRLYLNNGKGSFSIAAGALPDNHISKLCVRVQDIDHDGKPDLFVSGRVEPGKYPRPVSSFIFKNISEKGKPKFIDITSQVAPELENVGLVCDALFTDFDNDNQADLILAGEWMPVTFLKNTGGKFKNVTASTGIAGNTGWWNSIAAGDFRHTGRTDYIVGNVGLNTYFQASDQRPVFVTAKDFDKNGSYVPILSQYLPATDGTKKEFPAFGRDEMIERIPTLKKRYDNYGKFAGSTMEEIITPEMRKDAQRLQATMLQSCFLRNDGNGKFTIIPLPLPAQYSVVNGMLADDFDGDGNLDVLINGNDFGTEVATGRYNALNGLLLKGKGDGSFQPLTILESGIYLPGDGKALVQLKGADGKYLVAASQNRGPLKLYALRSNTRRLVPVNSNDESAVLHYKNGNSRKQEFYNGSGFLSQSARYCATDSSVVAVEIRNNKGEVRKIAP